jgi:4-amino-4-deoxy-L-arabinose transferase-like glycosyltransferase
MRTPTQARAKLRWPSGARARIAAEIAIVSVLSIAALAFGVGSVGISGGPSAQILSFGAMDEAVYGHAAARIVRTGHVATPIFLDRLLLNKPPLLMWAGAASMWLFGISPLALRLPVVLAGAACCVLVYIWLRRSRPPTVALAGVVLLLGTPLFHTVARRFTTDVLLTLFLVAPLVVLLRDARLERRWSVMWFGVLSGAAIMTKSAAGLLPLLVLFGYWLVAGKESRPAVRRLVMACAVAAAVAAPWHVYQFIVHREWFVT